MKSIFDVSAAAPTSDEMAALKLQNPSNPLLERVAHAVFFFSGVVFLACLVASIGDWKPGVIELLPMRWFFIVGTVIGGSVFIGTLAFLIHRIWPRDNIQYLLGPLNPHACSALADLINSSKAPEVIRYRDEVLAQNREFCRWDAKAIGLYVETYKAQQELDTLRAKLYNPPRVQNETA
jgi:hypothetical protein